MCDSFQHCLTAYKRRVSHFEVIFGSLIVAKREDNQQFLIWGKYS